MNRTGYLVKPEEPTPADRKALRERMAKIRAHREQRRGLHGPVDVTALVREARSEQRDNGPADR